MHRPVAERALHPATATAWPASGRRVNRILAWFILLYEYLVFYAGLALFASSIFIWSAVAAALYSLLPRKPGTRLGQFAIMVLFRGFLGALKASGIVKLDLDELDALRNERALIIAPNHPSLLDAVLVASRLPQVTCIMKAEIWDNLILGGGARFAAYIRDDCPRSMVRSAVAAVRAGHQLLMFPEGTRTRQKAVYRCKGGFALIAKTARVPVQTVFIETNSPFLGKGWPLSKKPAFPLVFRARLGKRFEVNGDVKAVAADLEKYYATMLPAGPAVHGEPQ